MKQILIAIFAVITVMVISAGLAIAHNSGYGIFDEERHETMEEIMENGTFEDLEAYRQDTGLKIMPWVDSEEDFEKAQGLHEQMEGFHEENGYGQRGAGGCPMRAQGGCQGGGYGECYYRK